MTNNSLLKVNGSEEKVYKVEVLKLGKRVESHFRLGGAFEHNFCPEGWNLNKSILTSSNARKVKASD